MLQNTDDEFRMYKTHLQHLKYFANLVIFGTNLIYFCMFCMLCLLYLQYSIITVDMTVKSNLNFHLISPHMERNLHQLMDVPTNDNCE